MTQLQLELFIESREDILSREIEELKNKLEKQRKSLHAKNSNLEKMILENRHELETLKQAIIKNTLIFSDRLV